MSLEGPLVTALIARLPDDKIHLAAFAVVFAVALVIEAPIIMLLAASTALVGDRVAFRRVWRFMMQAGGGLTALHALVAFTPLFDLVADAMRVPAAVLEPARRGMQIFTPWTWAIAYRRFYQGILIRCEATRFVSIGTALRLATNALVGGLGLASGQLPGITVGASAVAAGVTVEALFIGLCARPFTRSRILPTDPVGEELTGRRFLSFYLPLAMTPLLTLLLQPLGTAAMNSMPAKVESVASWPGVHGIVFLLRSVGFAFNEVVVALILRPGGKAALEAFAWRLALATSGLLLLAAVTPLGAVWFGVVSGLSPDLVEVSHAAIAFAVLMPAYQVYQSLYQGALVAAKRSRPVTEAVVLYLVLAMIGLGIGVSSGAWTGLYAALVAFNVAGIAQTIYLGVRAAGLSRPKPVLHGAA